MEYSAGIMSHSFWYLETKSTAEYLAEDISKKELMELSLNEQILLNETRAILSLIYRSYLCNADEKRKLNIDDSIELTKKQIELNKKYSYENLFKKN